MSDGKTTADHACVTAARTGDADAFRILVERYYGTVRGLAVSVVSDCVAAEDIAQEVFLVAWTNLNRLRRAEAFLMWLRKITRNCARNWLRKEHYRRKLAERHARRP